MEGYRQGGGKWGRKGIGNKKHNWQVQDIQGEVKNSIGNGEAQELVRMSHGHELRAVECCREWWYRAKGNKGEKKNGTTVIA